MTIDLHAHTTASDGVHAPADLVAIAAEHGLEAIAVTDHDTVAGVAEAAAAGERLGVRVVPGIEVSSRGDTRNVHMLGLFVDPGDPVLRSAIDRKRTERLDRAHRIVQRLNDLGYEITFEEVREQASGDVVARPHIARALVRRGYVRDVPSAFTPELIGDGGRALVRRQLPTPEDAVALIRSAGGAAVWAHPAASHHRGERRPIDEELVARLCDAGLAGLEVDHPDHTPLAREAARGVAERFSLVATGGSDFHGHEWTRPGVCTTTPEAFEELQRRAGT